MLNLLWLKNYDQRFIINFGIKVKNCNVQLFTFLTKICLLLKNKNQLDATYYFTILLIGSTCFGHYYVYHEELAIIILINTLVVSFLVCCRLEVRCGEAGVVSGLQANQERNAQCGNQRYSREFLMMDIVVPETC